MCKRLSPCSCWEPFLNRLKFRPMGQGVPSPLTGRHSSSYPSILFFLHASSPLAIQWNTVRIQMKVKIGFTASNSSLTLPLPHPHFGYMDLTCGGADGSAISEWTPDFNTHRPLISG